MAEDRQGAVAELAQLENRGWQALSSTGEEAGEFYRNLLDDEVTMVLPGNLRLTDREETIAAMSGPPWQEFMLQDLLVLLPEQHTGIVSYGVIASRAGQPEYSALASSTYIHRNGRWRLAFHQQTPR